jgi:hypothetical protein
MTDRTLTAMYDTRGAAETARDQLIELGVAVDAVAIRGVEGGETAASSTPAAEDRGFWASLSDLFMPDEDRHTYAEGLNRQRSGPGQSRQIGVWRALPGEEVAAILNLLFARNWLGGVGRPFLLPDRRIWVPVPTARALPVPEWPEQVSRELAPVLSRPGVSPGPARALQAVAPSHRTIRERSPGSLRRSPRPR